MKPNTSHLLIIGAIVFAAILASRDRTEIVPGNTIIPYKNQSYQCTFVPPLWGALTWSNSPTYDALIWNPGWNYPILWQHYHNDSGVLRSMCDPPYEALQTDFPCTHTPSIVVGSFASTDGYKITYPGQIFDMDPRTPIYNIPQSGMNTTYQGHVYGQQYISRAVDCPEIIATSGSLVLDYAFNTQTGNTTPDASSYTHTGTLHNGASVGGQGRDGAGLICDGTDDYVDTGTANILPQGATEATIALWTLPNEVAMTQTFMGNYWGGGGQGWMLGIYNSKIRWQQAYAVGASEQFSHPTPVAANTWSFVAVRLNNGRVTIWNGRNKAETTFTSAHNILRGDYAVRLCHRRQAGTAAEYFNGVIDNVRVWTSALTDQEILALYNPCTDADEDGYSPGDQPGCQNGDCNDNDARTYPGAAEVCQDGYDNDCNGVADENCCTTEICNGLDDDCDARIDEDLTSTSECDVLGACAGSRRTCNAGVWSACNLVPFPESCNGQDDDCDGGVDEGCACTSGQTLACGIDVGDCTPGLQVCANSVWGACIGAVLPANETCGNGRDENCDGSDERCACTSAWTCGAWGTCSGGIQARSCTDTAACTPANPGNPNPTTRACTKQAGGWGPFADIPGWAYGLIAAGAGVLLYTRLRRKKRKR